MDRSLVRRAGSKIVHLVLMGVANSALKAISLMDMFVSLVPNNAEVVSIILHV